MKSSFEVSGMEAYLDALQKAGKDIDLVSRAALREAGEILQAEMIRRVPVKTGRKTRNLIEHIRIFTPSGEGHYNYVFVGIIHKRLYTDKATAIQANAVEYGSVHNPAMSFVRSTIRAKKAAIVRLIREHLQAARLVD